MEVKNGDKVKIHYTLKAGNGETIESSAGSAPLELKLGEGKMIPGFEKGVIGMKQGESKTITVSPEEAYGLREEKKVFEFSREKAPAAFDPRIGDTVQMHALDGSSFKVTVVDLTEKAFIMDANHPLAGKDLVFDLELVEVVS
jgi:peptidylprolyl isomerase